MKSPEYCLIFSLSSYLNDAFICLVTQWWKYVVKIPISCFNSPVRIRPPSAYVNLTAVKVIHCFVIEVVITVIIWLWSNPCHGSSCQCHITHLWHYSMLELVKWRILLVLSDDFGNHEVERLSEELIYGYLTSRMHTVIQM